MTPENRPRTERPAETDTRGPTGPPERPGTETNSCDDQRLTEEVLLADLRQVAQDVEGELTEREYADRGRFGVTTYRRRFGSWNAAKRAAGLQTSRRPDLTDEALADDLARLAGETDQRYVTPALYAAEGTYRLSELPEDREFWESMFGRLGIQISPLYHRFVSDSEEAAPPRN